MKNIRLAIMTLFVVTGVLNAPSIVLAQNTSPQKTPAYIPSIDSSNFIHQVALTSGYNVQYHSSEEIRKILAGKPSVDWQKTTSQLGAVIVFDDHEGVVNSIDLKSGTGTYMGPIKTEFYLQPKLDFNLSDKHVLGFLAPNEKSKNPILAKRQLDIIDAKIDKALREHGQKPYYGNTE